MCSLLGGGPFQLERGRQHRQSGDHTVGIEAVGRRVGVELGVGQGAARVEGQRLEGHARRVEVLRISTNFNLPDEAMVASRFNPSVSFLQFGIAKQDGDNDGRNNGLAGTFSRVQKSGGDFQFDDSFTGPGLTANYSWRVTNPNVLWVPEGLGYWLSWSTPDDGFSVQTSGDVAGPYTDAGVTYTYSSGATRIGAIPASSIPAGNSAFFRLMKPGQ